MNTGVKDPLNITRDGDREKSRISENPHGDIAREIECIRGEEITLTRNLPVS